MKKKSSEKPLKENGTGARVLLSYDMSADVRMQLEDHIDLTKIKMRKREVKFARKEMYEFLTLIGIKHFNADEFLKWKAERTPELT